MTVATVPELYQPAQNGLPSFNSQKLHLAVFVTLWICQLLQRLVAPDVHQENHANHSSRSQRSTGFGHALLNANQN